MKKNRIFPEFAGGSKNLKFLRIMKLTAAILLIACLKVSAGVYSQTRITLNMQSTDVKKVLATIEKKSSYRFLYSQSLLEPSQKVSVNAVNEEVLDVVNRIFENTGIGYEVLENNLVVLKRANTVIALPPISGRIVNSAGEPLAGVSITIKGSTVGTSTKTDGTFSLNVPDDATLVISYVGHETQEIKVSGRTDFNITLAQSTKTIDQVVVIGYGTASKRDLTGSIVKVQGKDLADKPNTNPISSLQGKVAGVSIVNSGIPGQEPDIRIRGTISRTQTKPLYVVDGIFNDNINYINPSDIESMEILKDPSSLAIFGVRGANGVIIVTTKKARTGQLTVGLNTMFGVKKIVDKIKLTDAANFKMLYDEQRANQNQAPYANYSLYTGNSDWVDLIKQDAFITQNNLSLSSGTDKNKFYMGLGYIMEEGVIKHEKLEKLLLTLNDELKVSKNIKVGFTVNGYRAKLPQSQNFGGAVIATPIVEPFNTTHNVYNRLPDEIGGPQIANPLMIVEETKGTDISYEYRVVGSIYAEVNFAKKFTFRANYFGDLGFNNERRYTPIINSFAADFDAVSASSGYNITKVYQKENRFGKFQQEYLLTYKNSWGDHNLTLLGGFTTYFNNYTETNGEVRQQAGGNPIPNDKRFWYLDNFFGDPTTKTTAVSIGNDAFGNRLPLQWEQATVSFLARALYNYQGKYMFNASFRRDGSSDISPNNRYQNFIAFGAAWEMSRENFMEKQNIFDFVKVKASWGILGNQYTQIHYPFYPLLSSGVSAVFGNNIVPAYVPSFLADQNLKWETVESREFGVEFATFQNRLLVEFNIYNKVTDNLLTTFPGLGGQKPGITNAGKIENKGIEASASWNQKFANGVGITISGNITTLNNKVKELYQTGFEIIDGPSRTTAGFPIGYFYGYISDGLYQSFADKLGSPNASSLGDYGPGDIKFRDINGDSVIDDKDRTMIGNPTPDFIYGFSLGANYKGFDISVDFQGVYGNEIFRSWGNGASFAVFNYREARLNRWHGEGTSNWEPIINDNNAINRQNSTYMIEDGSYFRIRNLQIGYNFESTLLSKVHIRTARVFLNGQNIKTFKNNSGFTPEFGGSAISFGVDGGSYPLPAVYTFGLNLTF